MWPACCERNFIYACTCPSCLSMWQPRRLSALLLTAADGTKRTHLKSPSHDCSCVNETTQRRRSGGVGSADCWLAGSSLRLTRFAFHFDKLANCSSQLLSVKQQQPQDRDTYIRDISRWSASGAAMCRNRYFIAMTSGAHVAYD